MKASEAQSMETATAILRARAKQQKKATLLMALSIVVILILPRFIPSPINGMVMLFGSAIGFTTCVLLNPDSFRSRRGSLTIAICLVTALWSGAVGGTVLLLIGAIR